MADDNKEAKEAADNYDVDDYGSSNKEQKKRKLAKGKYWDEEAILKFVDEMEDAIMDRCKAIDSFANQSSEIDAILSKILDLSQKKLEDAKKADYKYWSNCMIFDKRCIYRKHMKFFWEKDFDKMISVKVNTERLHIILIAHCVFYGKPQYE